MGEKNSGASRSCCRCSKGTTRSPAYQVNFILPEDLPLPSDPGYFYRVELLIEDGGEEFRSQQVLLPVQQGDHQITGVCDAAGCQELISPGSIASIFGNFAEQMAVADSVPLSMNLNGYSVTFNGIPGALFGVFPGQDGAQDQANVQVPWGIDVSGGTVDVQVHWEDDAGTVSSEPFTANAAQASPGIFLLGPRAIVTNFSQAGDDVIPGSWAQPEGFFPGVTGQPAAIGGVITVWCGGLGPVTETPATGDIPMGDLPFTTKEVRVFIGGVQATVLASVLNPEFVGLNQINAFVPDGVTPGDEVPIVIEVECDDGTILRTREDATIAVRPAP